MSDWLNNLKEGDTVIIESGGAVSHRIFAKVEKTTKQHFIVKGDKYRRNGGWSVRGNTWSRARLVEATKETVAEMQRKKKIDRYRNRLYKLLENRADEKTLLEVGDLLEAAGIWKTEL